MSEAGVIVCGTGLEPLAERLQLPWRERPGTGLALSQRGGELVLSGDEAVYGAPLKVDFVSGRAAHRRRFGGGRGQLVAKACGLGKVRAPHVVDATAGLGRDAFVLASLGAEVLLLERIPAIFALLEDGLARARRDPETAPIAERMRLVQGDAAAELDAILRATAFPPEVIHLDPMFPHRDKSALVKKEMRIFRDLAGDDDDAPLLLQRALAIATHRVAVKRPRKAPPLDGPAPQHVIEGKTSRYDLYVHRALAR